MGIIRKTASIGTFGLVSFRSKKERLRRAEAAQQAAEDDLAAERLARETADERVAEAERRARKAELAALHEAKAAARSGHRLKAARAEREGSRHRRARRKARGRRDSFRDHVGNLVEAAQPLVEDGAATARRGGRAARRQAKQLAKTARARVES
jgi:hypothetical protein